MIVCRPKKEAWSAGLIFGCLREDQVFHHFSAIATLPLMQRGDIYREKAAEQDVVA